MQVFAIVALMSILWAIAGYSLAFTEGPFNSIIGGFDKAFLAGITPDTLSGTIPEYVFVTFQLTFACITPALIIGAFAERIKFSAVLWFSALWLFVSYIPICHMVWGGGYLGSKGALDFAGGTVVHINAAIAGLVICLVLGKRLGYGKEAMPPHNLPFTMVGAALLWVGWFGFNVGSELAADGTAGLVLLTTQLCTAASVLGWLFIEWITRGKPTMLGGASGAVAGLVAITPRVRICRSNGSDCFRCDHRRSLLLRLHKDQICIWLRRFIRRLWRSRDWRHNWGNWSRYFVRTRVWWSRIRRGTHHGLSGRHPNRRCSNYHLMEWHSQLDPHQDC